MRIFRHYTELPEEARGAVVALGNFDGVHLGHREVIGAAGREARALNAPHGVLTFEPHPRSFFQPATPPFRLTPFRIKARHLEALAVDFLYVLHFDREFSQITAQDFVAKVLVEGLGVRHVVTGYDFVFGQGRGGNAETLAAAAVEHGFGYTRVAPVEALPGVPYSSTRVRDHLLAGEPDKAAFLLGRDWEIEGRVEPGEQIGRDLGFPTANVRLGEYLHPAFGIYAVKAGLDAGEDTVWLDGVANLGQRPTFDGKDILLEVHLFDFKGDLYGRHLRTRLIRWIRPEKRFDGLAALRAQIADDCSVARDLLTQEPASP
ncbi:MAG: bifunctional riboflavin kinase/FAD synthetase [Alphaproteobacteria bacterium]|nr:bifunctional riboflavin kinase/FAD synthetase [Alphaproteobacteria bacterium]